MSKFSEILIMACRKIISAFYPILAVTAAKNNSKLVKENEKQNGWNLSVNKKIWSTLRLLW